MPGIFWAGLFMRITLSIVIRRLVFHTHADVHFGMTGQVDGQRLAALEKAWAEHPERFGKNRLLKKMLLPEVTWNNEPLKQEEGEKCWSKTWWSHFTRKFPSRQFVWPR
jgi:hypothetical protein